MGENKECRVDALAYTRDDYIFECAMKNPTPTKGYKKRYSLEKP